MYTNSSRSYLKMASGTPRRTNGTPWRTGGTPTAEYSEKERILESKASLETVNACWSYLNKVGKLTDDAADNCVALRNLAISDLNRYNASLANWDKTHPYLKSWWESEHMIMKNSNCDALNSSFIG